MPGYTTVETLKRVAGTLLDKSGGYLSNDLAPPGLWLDNMPNWEYGVLVQVRDLSRALRKDFARSQSQSTEDADLAKAEPRFNFDNKSWALPASEQEYRAGIQSLSRFQTRLADPNQSQAQFYARADNLRNWLTDVETRLGSLSQRLSASVGQMRLNTDLSGAIPAGSEEIVKTPWLQIDNVFYEARGQAWALSHFLRAIEVDFADVLAKKNATVGVRQIIRELEAAQGAAVEPDDPQRRRLRHPRQPLAGDGQLRLARANAAIISTCVSCSNAVGGRREQEALFPRRPRRPGLFHRRRAPLPGLLASRWPGASAASRRSRPATASPGCAARARAAAARR